jgi:hypothetical protein
MALEPWLVEAALARLDRTLSPADQRTIVKATRTPPKGQMAGVVERTSLKSSERSTYSGGFNSPAFSRLPFPHEILGIRCGRAFNAF